MVRRTGIAVGLAGRDRSPVGYPVNIKLYRAAGHCDRNKVPVPVIDGGRPLDPTAECAAPVCQVAISPIDRESISGVTGTPPIAPDDGPPVVVYIHADMVIGPVISRRTARPQIDIIARPVEAQAIACGEGGVAGIGRPVDGAGVAVARIVVGGGAAALVEIVIAATRLMLL